MTDPLDSTFRYIDALESALRQIDIARRLRPDHGLAHAHDRLRALIAQAAVEAFGAEDGHGVEGAAKVAR